MGTLPLKFEEKKNRRTYGIHFTSIDIFYKYIIPEIKNLIFNYTWVDLYAGEGNLILPILEYVPIEERECFFQKHIYLSDIRPEMIAKCIKNIEAYDISFKAVKNNVLLRDNLERFPDFLKENPFPIFHITNPPYLYLGYIRKNTETQKYLKYFQNENDGYQDLYQIAMINDLRNNIKNLIYIIPSNFLFGSSVSNKFRMDFLKYYSILKIIILETRIFEFTGTNICIGFFNRKVEPMHQVINFMGEKVGKRNMILTKEYILKPEHKYRAGSEFEDFLNKYRLNNPLKVEYYLLKKDVVKNQGKNLISIIDANTYKNNQYKRDYIKVNDKFKKKILANKLYIKTVDTGSYNGRVGLSFIDADFKVNGIYVSGNTYRTHPIQIFIQPILNEEDQILLKEYFNFVLEYYRKTLDSEFLTTYKYSNAEYTRKYLGLTQVRKLIETFPIHSLNSLNKHLLSTAIEKNDFKIILKILEKTENK